MRCAGVGFREAAIAVMIASRAPCLSPMEMSARAIAAPRVPSGSGDAAIASRRVRTV